VPPGGAVTPPPPPLPPEAAVEAAAVTAPSDVLTLPERRVLFADASTHRGKGRVNVAGGGLGRGRERYAGGGTQDVFPLGVPSSWRRCTVSVIVAHARWLKGTTLRGT